MAFYNQLFAAAAACTLMVSVMPSDAAAQQTTKDGIRWLLRKNVFPLN